MNIHYLPRWGSSARNTSAISINDRQTRTNSSTLKLRATNNHYKQQRKRHGTVPDAGVEMLLNMLLGKNSKAKLCLKERLFLLDKP